MKHTNKKGFTIVELVIVIAVIAILAAVLIPTFSNLIKKANQSSDIQLIRNLNNAVAAAAKENITIAEAIAAAATFDIAVDDIEAKAKGNKILWDDVAKVFCYLNGDTVEYISNVAIAGTGADLWIIDTDGDTETDADYSSYVLGVAEGATINAKNGIDVTGCPTVTVNYAEAGNVNIYTKASDTLVINNAGAEVDHYGAAALVDVKDAAPASYHLFGKVATLRVTKGNVVPEVGAKIQVLVIEGSNVTLDIEFATNTAIATAIIDTSKVTDEAVLETITNAFERFNVTPMEIADTSALENTIAELTAFAGGSGTAEDPYLIETAQHLKNINTKYAEGYKYYKVADGVATIDCANWPVVKLNGSFNGNGVKLVNLPTALFNTVGYNNNVDTIVLENFEATMNVTNGNALVRNIFNGGETTFKNVKVHGYIEGEWNMGSFYNYGTANLGGSDGCNYTINFVNSTSDATLVGLSSAPGGMIGHTYPGAGNAVTINMDAASGFKGTVFSNNGKATAVAAILNGTLNGATNTQINANKIDAVVFDTTNGYSVAKATGASYMVVTITAQVTSYDEEGNQIANSSGITIKLDSQKITTLADNTKVFENVTDFEIVNEYLNNTYGYEVVDGVLKVYVGPRNALTGWSTLQVSQYKADGTLLATGSYRLGEIK